MTIQGRFWWDDAEPVEIEDFAAEWEAEKARERDLENQLEAAAQDVQRANTDYDAALRRVRLAAHGDVSRRRSDLRQANARVLGAELRFAELRKHEPR
jgi:hypothetical protein